MAQEQINCAGVKPTLPYWSQVLKALRTSRGITQESWSAQLNYSRATIRRWESGRSVPSAVAEQAIVSLCESRHIFRDIPGGPFDGHHLCPEWLADTLAAARLEMGDHAHGEEQWIQAEKLAHSGTDADRPRVAQLGRHAPIEGESFQILTTLVRDFSEGEGSGNAASRSNQIPNSRLCHEVSTDTCSMIACDCLTHALLYVSEKLQHQRHDREAPRLGVHIGDVRNNNNTLSGKPVEICNEISRLAQPGTGLVSGVVAELAGDGPFLFTPMDEFVDSYLPQGVSVLKLEIPA